MGVNTQPNANPYFDGKSCLGHDTIEEPGKTKAARLAEIALRPLQEAEVSKFGIH